MIKTPNIEGISRLKNVVLVTIDCLRADYTDLCDQYGAVAPNLNKLARDSTIFCNAFSHGSTTQSSFPAILTSTYPIMYGGYPHLSSSRITLSEVLQRHGFTTGAFTGQNPFLSRFFGYNRGFKVFEDFAVPKSVSTCEDMKFFFKNYDFAIRKCLTKLAYGLWKALPYAPADMVVSRAMDFIKKNASERFFLWVHFMDVHFPYYPPPKYVSMPRWKIRNANLSILHRKVKKDLFSEIKSLYAASIRYVDENLGRLLDYLKDEKLKDSTAIIVTSDHGEEFFEHGDFGHSTKLYDELLHVPLIIFTNGLLTQSRVRGVVGQTVIAPTVLSIVNLPKPSVFLGKDLLTSNENGSEEQSVISECSHRWAFPMSIIFDLKYLQYAVRTWKWKFISYPKLGKSELYDSSKDPHELNNVAEGNPEIVEKFRGLVDRHMQFEMKTMKHHYKSAPLDDALSNRLRALGYA